MPIEIYGALLTQHYRQTPLPHADKKKPKNDMHYGGGTTCVPFTPFFILGKGKRVPSLIRRS
jgi:hypothetical protein